LRSCPGRVEGDDDLRKLPLHLRKSNLERLLARRPEGIFVNPVERGGIGLDLFRAACQIAIAPTMTAGCPHWIKVKNRKHPAMSRVMDAFR
jgi:bifunctional non-homologous end joining protein LigD